MIYFTAHTFKCVCHCIRTMFRVLGVYNFDLGPLLTSILYGVAKIVLVGVICSMRMTNLATCFADKQPKMKYNTYW